MLLGVTTVCHVKMCCSSLDRRLDILFIETRFRRSFHAICCGIIAKMIPDNTTENS